MRIKVLKDYSLEEMKDRRLDWNNLNDEEKEMIINWLDSELWYGGYIDDRYKILRAILKGKFNLLIYVQGIVMQYVNTYHVAYLKRVTYGDIDFHFHKDFIALIEFFKLEEDVKILIKEADEKIKELM